MQGGGIIAKCGAGVIPQEAPHQAQAEEEEEEVEVEEVEETKAGLAKAKGYTDNERLG
jgi:hypothetical protein